MSHQDAPENFGGDLYNSALIERFRGTIVKREYKEDATFEAADTLVVGDSFAATSLDSDPVGAELEKRIGGQVLGIRHTDALEGLAAYASDGKRPDRDRVLILITAERFALSRARGYLRRGPLEEIRKNPAVQKIMEIKSLLLVHTDVSYFYTHNRLIFPLFRALKNLRYHLLGRIDAGNVGAFSKEPPFLFLKEEVEFDRMKKTPEDIREAARGVAALAARLREEYRIRLVYVVVPNKYSLYHEYVRDGYVYDGFIPSFCAEIRKLGAEALDLYSLYRAYREEGRPGLLYYPSDTHWTPLGKSIFIEEWIRYNRSSPNG